jgi:hypothetical protein
MTVIVSQDQNTRRRAVALMGHLREGDPDATGADLALTVLWAYLNRRGLDLPARTATRYRGARPTITDAATLYSRPRLPVPGGAQVDAALRLAAGTTNGDTVARTWREAVAECYFAITAPVTAEDLGPQTGAWVAQGPRGPFEAAA